MSVWSIGKGYQQAPKLYHISGQNSAGREKIFLFVRPVLCYTKGYDKRQNPKRPYSRVHRKKYDAGTG